jgi:hypothetical protein
MKSTIGHQMFPVELRLERPLLLFALALCLALSAACQDTVPVVIRANREIGVSSSPSYIAYDEYKNGAVLDSERGWVSGVGVKATTIFNALNMPRLLFGAIYDFNNGSSNHLDEGNPVTSLAGFRSNDVQFWLGKGFLTTPKLFVTVEAGSEYREWLRLLPTGEYDTREDYTFWAPGFRLGASVNPLGSLVINGKAEFGYTVSPVNAGGGNPNALIPVPPVNMILRPHPLWQFAGGGDWAMTRAFHGYADANYLRFGFGRSANEFYDDGLKSHYEPSSVTHSTRIDIGLAWAF